MASKTNNPPRGGEIHMRGEGREHREGIRQGWWNDEI